MDRNMMVILVAVAVGVVLLAVLAYAFTRKRRVGPERMGQLRQQFGPEYDVLARERGEKDAARELEHRVKRVQKFHIEPLGARDRARFADAWEATQRKFVDDPKAAVHDADELVKQVMSTRGYPVEDFEQRVRDVSVDHPQVVENYRSARVLSDRADQGQASTEDLRRAMVHFHALFAELLEDGGGPRRPVPFGKERYA